MLTANFELPTQQSHTNGDQVEVRRKMMKGSYSLAATIGTRHAVGMCHEVTGKARG